MEEKKAGLKYFLFLGIPVLIVLIVLGCYYKATNPMTILTKTINNSFDLLIDNVSKIETKESEDLHFNGNLEFKTDMDLGNFNELQNYNYDFNLTLKKDEKFAKISLGINNQNDDIIHANFYQIKKKQYLEVPKVFEQILEVEEVNNDDFFNSSNLFINSDEFKIILKKIKTALIESLDSSYLEREKKDITINNTTVKTTKISYLLDEENQKRTLKFIIEKLTEDEEFIESYSNLTQISKDDSKELLKDTITNFEYKEDFEINLFTEGLNQNVIQIAIESDSKNILTYTNYKDEKIIKIENWNFELIEWNENEIILNYKNEKEKINGNIKIISNDNLGTISLEVNTPETKTNIDLSIDIKPDEEIKIPDTNNSKKIEDLTNEEQLKIFENLENTLKDTFFYKLIEQNIM